MNFFAIWVRNLTYAALLCLLSPVIMWRAVRHGRYRRGLKEKFLGRGEPLASVGSTHTQPFGCDSTRFKATGTGGPSQGNRSCPVVWFHAVSVGEVVQLEKVVAEFRRQSACHFHVVVTTSTDTGYDLAVKRFADSTVTWFPLDFSWSVNAALDRIQPRLLVLMELEIWPNLIAACHQRNIPVAIVNARMSDKSVKGYRRIRPLIAPTLARVRLIAAQSQQYAQRLISLGADPQRIHVTGSVKFDGVTTDRSNPSTNALRQAFGIRPEELVFLAGSTQDPEEQICLQAWMQLREEFPQLRFISVPRHKERFEDVAAFIQKQNLPLYRRSSPEDHSQPSSVVLLDTIGELSAAWGLADVAFIGGSFGNRGGQNMIEPAAYGAVIMFGPNTSNFRDVVALFKTENACIQLASPAELVTAIRQLLTDASHRRSLGLRAQQVVLEQQGAIRQTAQLLLQVADAANRPTAKAA